MSGLPDTSQPEQSRWPALEVFRVFMKLGLTSFGGPIAHLSYIRREFVQRRQWLGEAAYAELVAVCQLLPGPVSSQVAFAIGLGRAKYAGAVAASIGFALPSAVVMIAFAYSADLLHGSVASACVHGLQLVAVLIVAQAVWLMSLTLCPDSGRRAIAIAALGIALFAPSPAAQITAIIVGALAGAVFRRGDTPQIGSIPVHVPRTHGFAALAVFSAFLIGAPAVRHLTGAHAAAEFEAFYRSGALGFGGGHVILPLLREAVVPPGWVGDDAFLAGYGAAQTLPGPLSTFAAYLGVVMQPPPNGLVGAGIALVAIFLPGYLLVVAIIPFWDAIRRWGWVRAAVRGINASVVGVLAAALYTPIWSTAVKSGYDAAITTAGLLLLVFSRIPPTAVVAMTVVAAALRGGGQLPA